MKLGFLPALALATAAMLLPAAAPAQRNGTVGRGGEVRGTPDQRDWTRTVERTPEGGFRAGNPDARTRLVEYLSLTCEHCATFVAQGGERLFNLVRSGRVSVEYRNHYSNGMDIAAAMLSRCATPENYIDMTHHLFVAQRQWMVRINALTPAQRQELGALAPLQVAERLIGLLGLDAIGARHGVTPAVRTRCLNQAGLDELQRMHQEGERLGVQGTPTFFINGERVQPGSWAELEPLLRG